MAAGRRLGVLIVSLFALVACDPARKPNQESPTPAVEDLTDQQTPSDPITLIPIGFDALPGWRQATVLPAISAFQRQCEAFGLRNPDDPLSTDATYGGKVSDWLPACSVLPRYTEVNEPYRFFEDYFNAFEIQTDDPTNKLTGYYEPELEVAADPTPEKSASIPMRPRDMVEAKLGIFDPSLEGKTVWGKVRDGKLELYPERADIVTEPDRVMAYADPIDVFFLQIQGSGRLKFPDGTVIRAGFDAHNHRPFESLANHLIQTGEIQRSDAGMSGIRRWMKKVGVARAQDAMNVNPRFVFFRERENSNPDDGPVGAAGLPLTPMGSVAVDRSLHPLGIPFFLDTTIPGKGGDWKGTQQSLLLIAQDTGGAIKGVRRGDIFFGWGDEAGSQAGSMNHEGHFYVLLPQSLEQASAATGFQ